MEAVPPAPTKATNPQADPAPPQIMVLAVVTTDLLHLPTVPTVLSTTSLPLVPFRLSRVSSTEAHLPPRGDILRRLTAIAVIVRRSHRTIKSAEELLRVICQTLIVVVRPIRQDLNLVLVYLRTIHLLQAHLPRFGPQHQLIDHHPGILGPVTLFQHLQLPPRLSHWQKVHRTTSPRLISVEAQNLPIST
jgi:hypothetical protein